LEDLSVVINNTLLRHIAPKNPKPKSTQFVLKTQDFFIF